MPTTSNFGWTTPADTDLVKDGALAIRTLGNGIDTSLVDLKGGTTGQILSKASNTDLDYTWINNDQGDITGVTAGTGLTGGGTSGAVTVSLDSPVAATLGGTAQTTYTTGDLLYASGTNILAKRAIGTSGQVLTVSSGIPTWATPSGAALVGVAVTLSASYSLSNATGNIINWDTELFDTDAFHSTSTNTSRLTVPTGKGGKYLVGCMGKFAANATGYRNTAIRLNGSNYINGSSAANVGSSGSAQTINIFVRSFVAGDYLEIDAYQNSGGSLNLESGDSNSTFYMIFLGA